MVVFLVKMEKCCTIWGINSIFAILTLFVALLQLSECSDEAQKLVCNKDSNRFKIVQFTDLHFGESYVSDYLELSLMDTILSEEKPDLVVLSGDIVSGYCWNGIESSNWFANIWDKMVQPLIKHNIPWIYTPGNHDTEADWNVSQIFSYDYHKYHEFGSLTQLSDPYITPIYDYNHTSQIASVIMIDTGSMSCSDGWNHYGCLRRSQIDTLRQIDSVFSVPSLIFMHISVPDLSHLYPYNNNDYNGNSDYNSKNNYDLPYIGTRSDHPECYDNLEWNDRDFVEIISDEFGSNAVKENIISILHGHDHDSDFIYLGKHDIMHGFGRYGARGFIIEYESDRSMLAGARVIEFDCKQPKNSWQTWIRDYKNDVYYNTSFDEMKLRAEKFGKDNNSTDVCSDVCSDDTTVQECHHAYQWQKWKPKVTGMYRHWFYSNIISVMDLFVRAVVMIENLIGYERYAL